MKRNIMLQEKIDVKWIKHIHNLDKELLEYFQEKLSVEPNISRKMVSFQANKEKPSYRWFRYKEAFSAELVQYLLQKQSIPKGMILDPFAGAGTAIFASAELGYDAEGIELLPIGQQICTARQLGGFNQKLLNSLKKWRNQTPWNVCNQTKGLNILRITEGAYPADNKNKIEKFLYTIDQEVEPVKNILRFSLLCILESISYTRKDGQYLRWDYRSNKKNGSKNFNKGEIRSFDDAIIEKIDQIIFDLKEKNAPAELFKNRVEKTGKTRFTYGSCLENILEIEEERYEAIITSPPYCNRYDYTRTYALELALLDIREQELIDFRQKMLSCTVENKYKNLLLINKNWGKALDICEKNTLLQEILNYLEHPKSIKMLNNNGIPRMVRGYFYEMACVIQECYRVLKKNGFLFMVNDNVRYAGVSISVDLILSSVAENIGFKVKNIWILPHKKGNSSQQMGIHGCDSLRKSIYIWEK